MLKVRKAILSDLDLFFDWVNDPLVREYSFNSTSVTLEQHTIWFKSVISNKSSLIFVFSNEANELVGQVRIQNNSSSKAIIGISIDKEHRGKGYALNMFQIACNLYFKENQGSSIHAYIKKNNFGTIKSIEKAGFLLDSELVYQSYPCYLYIKYFSE